MLFRSGGAGGSGGGFGTAGTLNTSLIDEFGGTIATVDLDANGGIGGGSYYNSSIVTVAATPDNLGAGTNLDGFVALGWPPQDFTPDSFSFVGVTGASPSVQYVSDYVQITGISGQVPISITSNGFAQAIRVCTGQGTGCGSWSQGATVSNNQYIQLRMTTGDSYFTTYTATVTVGTVTQYWTVETGSVPDNTPNSFTIPNLNNQPVNTLVDSDIVQITGINTPVSITAGNGALISICNGTTCDTFSASPRTISNGQGFKLRILTSTLYSTQVTSLVTVGSGASQTWTVTTGVQPDNTPTSFSFIDLTNRNLNTTYYSNSITIQAIDNTIPFTITNTSGQTGSLPTIVLNDVDTGLSSTTVALYDVVKLKYTT